jgi:uncharacterized protein (TIGR00255 family)
MIKSMTGYGKASCSFEEKSITVEIRSVNSKQLDINSRIPSNYKEKELEMRSEIMRIAERGKVDFSITIGQNETGKPVKINYNLLKEYFNQIKIAATELGIPVTEQSLLATLRLPDTFKAETPELTDAESNTLFNCLLEALSVFNQFRVQEGQALEKDMLKRLELILSYLSELKQFESGRIERIKERLQKNLNEFIPAGSIEANRFEQEVIYFLEKLDFTEEKIRLKNHCDYFLKTMHQEDSQGRKLSFIVQEMGREINTLGSKANDSDIQKYVVMMKDELEKIKEQLMNIL